MKKYKVGFTAGTFDMFHVGHLNLLKTAKSMCEHLIVGVNATDLVESYKHKTPLISEDQRLEIVSAIQYVDEAFLMHTLDKIDAYDKFQYDVVFIGDDYKGSDRYMKVSQQLTPLGIGIEFLPYTTNISSTILAKRILDNEMNKEFWGLKSNE